MTSGKATRALLPVLAVSGLLLLVMLAAALSGPRATGVPLPTAGSEATGQPRGAEPAPPPVATPAATQPPESGIPPYGSAILIVLMLFGLALLLLGLWFLVKRLMRLQVGGRTTRLKTSTESAPSAEITDQAAAAAEVAEALEAGLEQLDDDSTDPRQAVIACWLRLEAAATAAGTPRRPDDAPGELVERLLGSKHAVTATSLRRFANLYRRARYAPGEVEASMRDEARAILAGLRTELGVSAA